MLSRIALPVFLALTATLGCQAPRSSSAIVWRTYLPETYGDDGAPVPGSVVKELIERVARQFDGCTTTPGVEGRWLDGGALVSDRSIELEVACPAERREEARRLAHEIARVLRQRAVYFEVRAVELQVAPPD